MGKLLRSAYQQQSAKQAGMRRKGLRLSDWRIRTLKDRITGVEEYIAYRKELDKRLRSEHEMEDWLVRDCLWIRRRVNSYALGPWLHLLEIRKSFWESISVVL